MDGEAMLRNSARQIRAWNRGYRLAAKTAGRTPTHLLLSWLVNLLLIWTVSVILLWFAADVFSRNKVGEPVTKVIIGKFRAWNAVYGAPGESRR